MGVNIGNKTLKDAYIGNKPIKKIYLGDKLLWQRLPYDAEIEYLRTDNTAYIRLANITINSEDTIEVEFARHSRNNSYGIIYRTMNPYYFAFLVGNGGSYWTYKNETNLSAFDTTLNAKNILKQVKNVITLNNSLTTTSSVQRPFEATNSYLYLFKFGASDTRGLIASIYSFKISDENNVAKLNLIPVRVGQVGYMYDKVSGQLFGNTGTGNFILGNDI